MKTIKKILTGLLLAFFYIGLPTALSAIIVPAIAAVVSLIGISVVAVTGTMMLLDYLNRTYP